jgi:hypothetical protein
LLVFNASLTISVKLWEYLVPNGTLNDKTIVKYDDNVRAIQNGWYKEVKWNYFSGNGTVKTEHGLYCISTNQLQNVHTSMAIMEECHMITSCIGYVLGILKST